MKGAAETPHEDVHGLVQLARRELLRSAAGQGDQLKRERLIRAQRRVLSRRRRYRWGAGVLALAAVVTLLLRGPRPAAEPLLAYTIRHGNGTAQSTDTASAQYSFADGTAIWLVPDALLTVVSADLHAPRVRLDRGDADVKVVHRANTRWEFAAGPFEVTVVGTAFDLHWDPKSQEFALNLREGVVQVTGPVLDGPLLLRAGHKVSVSIETGRVAITSESATPAGSVASASPPLVLPASAASASPAPPPLSAPTAPAAPAAPASWRVLVARGRFAQVVSEAQALPLDSCFARCSAPDLRALGDAARYSGRASLAEQAFLALRSRFPGTSEAAVAAFLLGRTCETERRLAAARAWYERYLAEAPGGEFAVEAQSGRARVAGTP